tara:strand:- start:1813 stop:2103 length:291 start_codon:yes stop_codon:yes gene_type:complete
MTYYEDEPDENTSMTNFAKNMMNSFVVLTITVMGISLKKNLIGTSPTLFKSMLFIMIVSVLISTLGAIDQYVYNNLILGIGAAMGFQIMNWDMSSV